MFPADDFNPLKIIRVVPPPSQPFSVAGKRLGDSRYGAGYRGLADLVAGDFPFHATRVIDLDPEFMWDEDEPLPAALVGRARDHARQCHEFAFVGTAARWHLVNDWRGILFVALACSVCGQEIGRGIVWREPPSDSTYPWQLGYWARTERGVA